MAIAMYTVIVDISKKKVSLNSTSLVSMVPPCNKVSSSTRGFFVAKVFGIDFAGGKIIMDPIVSEEPSYKDN
jgi:ssDNA-binding replication factor A large subunit